jgi:hypothetical protein
MILEIQGGTTTGATPTMNIAEISRTFSSNSSCAWNVPTYDKNNLYLTSTEINGVSISYTARLELIQTNNSPTNIPSLNSITMVNNNTAGISTTNYSY